MLALLFRNFLDEVLIVHKVNTCFVVNIDVILFWPQRAPGFMVEKVVTMKFSVTRLCLNLCQILLERFLTNPTAVRAVD